MPCTAMLCRLMRLAWVLLLPLLGGAALRPAMAAERLVVGATFNQIFEQDADGRWQGLGVEVVRTLAARAGDTVKFQLYPWPRALAMVERGQADILVAAYRTAERQRRYAFLDLPLYSDRLVLYQRRGAPLRWSGELRSLAGSRIAVVRGWYYGERFEQARALLEVSEVVRTENALQMLLHGRVDVMATNARNSAALIGSLKLDERVTLLCPDIDRLDAYLAFPRTARFAAARQRYNELFEQMVRSGELERIGARYGVTAGVAMGAQDAGQAAACKAPAQRARAH